MDLKKLEQFKDKIKEIKILENRILEMQQESEEIVSDVVRASSKSFPYTEHTIKITGVNIKRRDKIKRVTERLNDRKLKLYRELEEIENFIENIEDSKVRQIIELRYIKGMTWSMVALKVYGYPNGDTPRKRIKRYFKKN
ncbi:hypothetical protein SAMN02744040_00093 [Tepidibacter thalassicus DSM 15285]|jgi:hypothetical protein|uniref:Uncharacterized protein n=3 Tax=Peptostreptococcaceae TaxID=186804 RepID=A0A1M5NKD1_9FIRM|nr:hypothetical protein SAMN02744040_00093 [Tepidibacter thalassicus DSM 15285]SHJ74778.1 hypothetical protein SAMN02744037_00735 [Tepidibacter formicigenes DSM 15518]